MMNYANHGNEEPVSNRRWKQYASTYRAREIRPIANWIINRESGSVVGLPGVGRSTLLGFLCHRPDALATYLPPSLQPVVLIPIDLNILPDSAVSTLYRVILRSFYQAHHYFAPPMQQIIINLYHKNEAVRDAFQSQSALLELLTYFQNRGVRIVWVINRFDQFYQTAPPKLIHTLRGLRDAYRGTLSYLVGMLQEIEHLPDLDVVEPLYHILDTNVCWVKPLSEGELRAMVATELQAAETRPGESELKHLWRLTGGYPSLVRLFCQWWLTAEDRAALNQWQETLLPWRSTQYRLGKIWNALTQEEQFALSELQRCQALVAMAQKVEDDKKIEKHQKELQKVEKQYYPIFLNLQRKGICQQRKGEWRIFGELFKAYVAQVEGRGRGRIWMDPKTGELYQGRTPTRHLTHLERSVMRFFVENPRKRHTHTDIIEASWPEDVLKDGVSTEPLYQIIRGLRKKIEPNPGKPAYIISWRGQPEGGYQFFPEGRPGGE